MSDTTRSSTKYQHIQVMGLQLYNSPGASTIFIKYPTSSSHSNVTFTNIFSNSKIHRPLSYLKVPLWKMLRYRNEGHPKGTKSTRKFFAQYLNFDLLVRAY